MDKAKASYSCLILLIMLGVLGIIGQSGVKAGVSGISVEDADYTLIQSVEYPQDLINIAKTIAPRIVLEYSEFNSKMDLFKSEDLNKIAKTTSSRIIVEYSDSICEFALQSSSDLNQLATTVKSRISIEYVDFIMTTNLQRPLFLPPFIKNLTAFQADISYPLPGIVVISYGIIDAREFVTVNFQYWNGRHWVDCATTTGEGLVPVGSNIGTWNAKADFNNCYTANMKIRIIADNGETISSSETLTFILDTENPPSPGILSPSNGTFMNKRTLTLDWSDVFDPSGVKYNLEIDEDPGFESPLLIGTWLTNSEYIITSKEALNDGTYYWRVKAIDNVGNQGNWVLAQFTIDATPPKADAGPDQIVNEDAMVTLDGSHSIDENGIIDYAWILPGGDGRDIILSGMAVNYVFETPGTYIITLKVTDPAGNYATDDVAITVLDKTKPTAKATYTITSRMIMWTVNFDASASSDNVGIINYEWDFGDGATATGRTASYTYLKPGVYNVILTVRDAAGNTDTISISVDVSISVSPWQALIFLTLIIFGAATTLIISLRKRKRIKE